MERLTALDPRRPRTGGAEEALVHDYAARDKSARRRGTWTCMGDREHLCNLLDDIDMLLADLPSLILANLLGAPILNNIGSTVAFKWSIPVSTLLWASLKSFFS